ncbi:MAG: VTT domain-containing protein [Clostridia bacterium]
MQEIFSNIYDILMNLLDSLGTFGPILGSGLIIVESIIPVLPLFVFITMNFIAFGTIVGFIVSWICTVLGCMLSYFLVKKYFRNYAVKKFAKNKILTKCMDYFEHLSVQKTTVILSIPFTPAFMMNIAAGLSNMNSKKFLSSILISKLFLVYFWGVVGTGLIDSLKNPKSLITVLIMVVIAYLASIIIKKIFKLD